jgi:hypothetical protein
VLKVIRALRSKADACLHFEWTALGLLIYLSWVDDILVCGAKGAVLIAKKGLGGHFTLDEQGEMKEYVGCKVERNHEEGWMKLTQPVMIQSFTDEFKLPDEAPVIPAKQGDILDEDEGDPLSAGDTTTYRSGVGKLLHMMKWSRNDILNRVVNCLGSCLLQQLVISKQCTRS